MAADQTAYRCLICGSPECAKVRCDGWRLCWFCMHPIIDEQHLIFLDGAASCSICWKDFAVEPEDGAHA